MNKLLIICGPTATGKTKLALKLAKKFNGELISADSRQVYKGMNVGTGKDIGNSEFTGVNNKYDLGYYDLSRVPLWLLDVVEPNQSFSVADYYQLAWLVIEDIWKRGKLPILVGGTGLYIKAIIDGIETIGIPPNQKLRSKLEKKLLTDLQNQLKELNLQKWNLMNNSDKNNKRRLVRAIEISIKYQVSRIKNNPKKDSDPLFVGLTASQEALYKRIDERVEKRVKQGIIKEIQSLLNKGYNWDLYSMSGLGYKQWKEYFQNTEDAKTAIEKWKQAECNYAKRQRTWLKKDKRIIWFDITKTDYQKAVVAKIANWYL